MSERLKGKRRPLAVTAAALLLLAGCTSSKNTSSDEPVQLGSLAKASSSGNLDYTEYAMYYRHGNNGNGALIFEVSKNGEATRVQLAEYICSKGLLAAVAMPHGSEEIQTSQMALPSDSSLNEIYPNSCKGNFLSKDSATIIVQ